jgi:type II secretory pathway predicted ATPase ExeA
MYEKAFGLKRRPFPATPDRGYYYPATSHEAALEQVLLAIAEDNGFALVTGAPGTGKTLLCHCLLDRLGADVSSAFLTNSHFSDRLSLLQAILYDLSLPYEDAGEQVLRLRLTEHLLKNCSAGRRNLLLIDEAQHLQADLLEELRLLGNLEAGKGKAFQVVLVSQEPILATLARPEMEACRQRLAARPKLEALELEEAVDYLLHHLRLAGAQPEKLIEEPALEILARGTRGVPRLLNQAAHQALQLAHRAEMKSVDSEAALEALAVLGLEADAEAVGGGEPPVKGNGALPGLVKDEEGGTNEGGTYRLFDSHRRA